MSKFKVGDRVVVVGIHNSFRGSHGEIVEVTEDNLWPYVVRFTDGTWDSPCPYRADELEFEHVYDSLSSPALEVEVSPEGDSVSHPSHYTSHPSGVECIEITKHMGFLDGNAMKYLWRYSLKNGVEDLYKCRQYLGWLIEAEEAKRG